MSLALFYGTLVNNNDSAQIQHKVASHQALFSLLFVDLLCFCSVLCLLYLCARLFICALWSPAGKGLTSWLSFVVSTVSL